MSRRPGIAPPPRAARFRGDRIEIAVLALALAVRTPGLAWGLPDGSHFFSWHPDEFEIAGRAFRMLETGDLGPGFFNYGSLVLYLTALVAWPAKALGWCDTVACTHLAGRLVAFAAGSLTAVVTMRLARTAVGAAAALPAGLLVALAPGHVLDSAWATVDVPATFFASLALLFAARAAARPGGRILALAGAAAGLAAGAKYNVGLVAIAPLLVAGRCLRGPARIRGLAIVLGSAAVAFVVTTPYALLDFDAFRRDLGYELLEHAREGHLDYFTGTGTGWGWHLFVNLPYALGIPFLIASLGGGLVLFFRRNEAALAVLAFGVAYFLLIGFSEVRFLRYTLPLVPVAAVAGAAAAGTLRENRPRVARVMGGLTLAWLGVLVLVQARALLAPDPRRLAGEWIDGEAAPGATVALLSEPWFHTATVTPWNGGARSRSRFEAERSPGGRYRIGLVEDWNADALVAGAPEFIVASEFEWREKERLRHEPAAALFREIDRGWVLAARFPGISARWRALFGGWAPHDWLYPFAEVRVWRRR
jgi:4-amino-4-deoxy-L-arabinose transferase-like glycosyltransferase